MTLTEIVELQFTQDAEREAERVSKLSPEELAQEAAKAAVVVAKKRYNRTRGAKNRTAAMAAWRLALEQLVAANTALNAAREAAVTARFAVEARCDLAVDAAREVTACAKAVTAWSKVVAERAQRYGGYRAEALTDWEGDAVANALRLAAKHKAADATRHADLLEAAAVARPEDGAYQLAARDSRTYANALADREQRGAAAQR